MKTIENWKEAVIKGHIIEYESKGKIKANWFEIWKLHPNSENIIDINDFGDLFPELKEGEKEDGSNQM